MTDKQTIIVDGVDVTKCPSYMDFKKCTMLSYISACEGSCAYTGFHNLLGENEEIKKQLKAKEQECERTKERLESFQKDYSKLYQVVENKGFLLRFHHHIKELDQLKEEVKSKTEYIQEQRDIINQYSKEIEMYKKCQGKRASKREEELKAENEKYSLLIEKLCDYAGLECDSEEQAMRALPVLASQISKARWIIDRYKQTLTEIKEIAENLTDDYGHKVSNAKQILQKISEVVE